MKIIELYNHNYNKTIEVVKRFILEEFKKGADKNRSFNRISNGILQQISKYKSNNFDKKLQDNCQEAHNLFNNRSSYYEGESEDVIKWILEGEIFDLFRDEELKEFKDYTIHSAINESLNKIYSHFVKYNNYYQLIYDTRRYEYFYLQDNERIAQSESSEFNEMMDIAYPNRIDERVLFEELKKMKKKTSKDKGEELNTDPKKMVKKNSLIEEFTDDERMLIAHEIFYSKKKLSSKSQLDLVSFLKFSQIIGSVKDESIFHKKPQNNLLYKKANVGLNYFESDANKARLLDSTISKLEHLKLNFILPELIKERRKLKQKG